VTALTTTAVTAAARSGRYDGRRRSQLATSINLPGAAPGPHSSAKGDPTPATIHAARAAALRVTMLGGICPSFISNEAPPPSTDPGSPPSLESQRTLLGDKLRAVVNGTAEPANKSSTVAEHCLWNMLPCGGSRTARPAIMSQATFKQVLKVEPSRPILPAPSAGGGSPGSSPHCSPILGRRGLRETSEEQRLRNANYAVFDELFGLNLRIFPALEEGREVGAIEELLVYAAEMLDAECVGLVVVDPVQEQLKVSPSALLCSKVPALH
jgi:hypothetical protein